MTQHSSHRLADIIRFHFPEWLFILLDDCSYLWCSIVRLETITLLQSHQTLKFSMHICWWNRRRTVVIKRFSSREKRYMRWSHSCRKKNSYCVTDKMIIRNFLSNAIKQKLDFSFPSYRSQNFVCNEQRKGEKREERRFDQAITRVCFKRMAISEIWVLKSYRWCWNNCH